MIGPSGCGKSTFIRCLNRMNDLVPGAEVDGKILYHGDRPLRAPASTRSRCGGASAWSSRRPNPFPKSIYDNVAWGPRVLGMKEDLDERVEKALRGAALWDEVKDRLKKSALSLSGGQQQRLCIARAIAIEPDVLLLDEPASALDPIATSAIEELMHELKRDYTIVIVTHNMQQAARVADMTAFFSLEVDGGPAHGHPRRVRRDREDLHESGRQADRGLRHRAVRMRSTFQQELDVLEATLQEEGELVLRALRGALNALETRDEELADEVIAFDDDVDERYLRIEEGSSAARPADAGRDRPAPRARDPAREPAPRADGGLLRHDREAHEARSRGRCRPDALVEGVRGDGLAPRGDDQDRARLLRRSRPRGAESLVELDELIDRANRRVVERILELGSDPDMREYGLRMVSSRGRLSGSGTTPSISASRSPTC